MDCFVIEPRLSRMVWRTLLVGPGLFGMMLAFTAVGSIFEGKGLVIADSTWSSWLLASCLLWGAVALIALNAWASCWRKTWEVSPIGITITRFGRVGMQYTWEEIADIRFQESILFISFTHPQHEVERMEWVDEEQAVRLLETYNADLERRLADLRRRAGNE